MVTPEGVDLHIELAEMSQRVAAFLLDLAIIVGVLVAFTLTAGLFVVVLRSSQEASILAIIWLLGFFFLRSFYFMAFELTPQCATPGKRALGLRVATRSGEALGFDAIFARNAMRELELFLPLSFVIAYAREVGPWAVIAGLVWSTIFALFPLFNNDRIRIGDFVAGTWVIRSPRRVLEPDLAQAAKQSAAILFTPAETDVYGIRELSVLEKVIRRRDPTTMTAVAARIRKKLGRIKLPGESDLEFLETYYVALRGRLEGHLLFGRRKRDKFDAS